MLKRRWQIALLVTGLLLATAAGAFGPIIRGRVKSAGARYGAEVSVDTVLPAWKGARLRGVHVKLADMPHASIDFDEVVVESGSPRRVRVHGGQVKFVGGPDEMATELAALRSRLATPAADDAPSAGGTDLALDGLTFELKPADATIGLTAKAVALTRVEGGLAIDAGTVELGRGDAHVSVAALHVDVKRTSDGMLLKKLTTEALLADLGAVSKPSPKPDASGATPVPVSSGAPSAAAAPSTTGESVISARVAAFRQRFDVVEPMLQAKLTQDAIVELGGVKIAIHQGDETLNLGPGTARLIHEDTRLAVEYASSASSDGKAFSVRGTLPKPGDPLAIDFTGGPITLATLGVRDGDFKLMDVADSTLTASVHLELSADQKRISASGDGTIERLAFDVKAVSPEPIRGLRLSFSGKADLDVDLGRAHVEQGEIEIGALDLKGDLDYQRIASVASGEAPKFKLRSNFEIPLTPCQSLLDAAPKGLLPTVAGIRMAGSLALLGHANLDTTNLDRDYDLDWTLANSCRVTEIAPTLDVKRFHKTFKRTAYTPEGKPTELDSGPGSGNWVAYSHISKFMETAVITCEDGRFESHDGFDHEAIKNSIRENLRTGKFVRGASTVSMQLAKNLYLSRTKTVSRKLEESILTMYLEQSLTKEQIIELYLNVVELGPMVYGIESAAAHYFHSTAAQLSVSQAFYLASILPNPQVQHFAAAGAVSPGWMGKLRVLMKYANKRNRLTDEELEEGLSEVVVRGSPTPMKDPQAPGVVSPKGGEGSQEPTDPAGFQLP